MSQTKPALQSAELIKEFLFESFEGLASFNSKVTTLEKNPKNLELINELYRVVHTMKGSACFLHFKKLQEVTHITENIFDLIKTKQIPPTADVIDVLLAASDKMSEMLKLIEKEGNEEHCEIQKIVSLLNKVANQESLEAAGFTEEEVQALSKISSLDVNVQKDSQFNEVLNNPEFPEAPQSPVEPKLYLVKSDDDARPVVKGQESVASMNSKEVNMSQLSTKIENIPVPENSGNSDDGADAKSEKGVADSVVRVNVNLLDKIMNVVGELVLNRNQILQYSNSCDMPELNRLAAQLNIITTELQSDIMTTRMQPIGSVLNKFERIVRDLARETKKRVSVRIEGKDTELDKTLLEAIKDPLTHLVRNAVDHGLETPEERSGKGKSPEGTLNIKAYHEGGQVTIEITDDGRGINRQKVVAKAFEKGLINADQRQSLSDRQVFNLIFMPGFSTAEKVTNISGRGVGMDVVKTNIEKIGGQVDIQSVEGKGTTFKLKIPLTLAIIPALIVRESGESFAIPQINLVELVRLEKEKENLIEKVQGSSFFRLRGDLIPILFLEEILNMKDLQREDTGEASSNEEAHLNNDGFNIVILNAEGRVFGIVVDEILDTQEIVVKPLGKQLKQINVFAGATIMGDGRVALIIDAMGIAQQAHAGADKKEEERDDVSAERNAVADRQEVLLFKLSGESRYGIPLSLVNRLEELNGEQVEFVRNQPIVRYRGQVMPLIWLNQELSVGEAPKSLSKDIVLPTFVTHIHNRYFGFVVEEIQDIGFTEQPLDSFAADMDGILGSVPIDGKTVTLVDVYQIIDKMNFVKKPLRTEKKKKTVLVVEDSPMFRNMTVTLLEEQGFAVLSASNGHEAIKLLGSHDVHLIVSDIEMPGMGGLELAKSVRADEKLKRIPMIAVSSRFSESDVKNGRSVGFDIYLEKFKKEEIISAVDEAFGKAA